MFLLYLLFGTVVALWVTWLLSRRKFYALMFKFPSVPGYPILGMGPKVGRKEGMYHTCRAQAHRLMLARWLSAQVYNFLTLNYGSNDSFVSPKIYNFVNNLDCTLILHLKSI